ncbi:MAG: cytochrome c oxidase subunit II [Chloroflexaceae bacterium]
MDDYVPFFPDQASTFAGQVDALFLTLLGLSSFFTLLIVGLIAYFGVKYRRKSQANRSGIVVGNTKMELAWMGGLLMLALPVFIWSASLYFHIFRPPQDALEIYVVGKQWMWKVQHPGGQQEINELHVPVDQPIRLIMTSQDAIHSFFVPAFRLKHDVLPGTYVTAWFEATQTGEYHLFCAEYCGAEHSGMIGQVIVMEPRDYQTWLEGGSGAVGPPAPDSMAVQGEQLFLSQGCSGCHRMNGSGIGPSLVGLFGEPVPLQEGGFATADETYIRESIYFPNAQIVAGYPAVMPAYEGQISEEEMLLLVAYIKSLAESEDAAPSPDMGGTPGTLPLSTPTVTTGS